MKYVSVQNDNTYDDYMQKITKIGRHQGGAVLCGNILYQIKAILLPIKGSN